MIGKVVSASLFTRLFVNGLVTLLPLVLLAVGLIRYTSDADSRSTRDALRFSAAAIMTAVDAELGKFFVAGRIFQRNPTLRDDPDIENFRAIADRNLTALDGAWIVIADAEGRMIFNSRVPAGHALAPRSLEALADQQLAFAEDRPVVSGLLWAPIDGQPRVLLTFPIYKDGRPYRALVLAVGADRFYAALNAHRLPGEWLIGLLDSKHRFVARSIDNDGRVGQAASPAWQAAIRASPDEGLTEVTGLEGQPLLTYWERNRDTGWTVGVSARSDLMNASFHRSLQVAAGATISLVLLAAGLALYLSRQVSKPIVMLGRAASALASDEMPDLEATSIRELVDVNRAFAHAAEARRRRESERQKHAADMELVMREMAHRSKNLLTVISAISRSLTGSHPVAKEFHERFETRIAVLAKSHDILLARDWVNVSLQETLDTYCEDYGERIAMSGPHVVLQANSVQNLSMALHELLTNALKHGALSVPDGRIAVTWTLSGEIVDFVWREVGIEGPLPGRVGFGSRLLRIFGTLTFLPEGVRWAATLHAMPDQKTGPGPPSPLAARAIETVA